MKYTQFGVGTRQWSSNALVGRYEKVVNGEKREYWDYILSFGHEVPKAMADKEIEKICKWYNDELQNNTGQS